MKSSGGWTFGDSADITDGLRSQELIQLDHLLLFVACDQIFGLGVGSRECGGPPYQPATAKVRNATVPSTVPALVASGSHK